MLGIVGGTSLLFSEWPDLAEQRIFTPYGPANLLCGEVVVLLRHQRGLPPHRINFRANMAALALCGVDRVIAIGSVGSLTPNLPPGFILIPTDYVNTGAIPSIHDHAIVHIRPEINPELSQRLACIVPEAHLGGVYVQSQGPRIETVAEVKMLSRIGDVVGMTMASEATLAKELDMAFAGICNVDNYAHGLGGEVLTYEHILSTARQHRDRTAEIIGRIRGEFG